MIYKPTRVSYEFYVKILRPSDQSINMSRSSDFGYLFVHFIIFNF